ncbi:MAG: alcohol dehydrogenase catalytic domain-containing protein [Nitrospirae bacterium]|nr:alcohol dehydrogenase catalytic domain-containing protein [Nitrospirota bacterium]
MPRDQEYCEAVDQRVAGLEFLTGVLIPGVNRVGLMDTVRRDKALEQATLSSSERQLALERLLRGEFGMPPAGSAVLAAVGAKALTPAVGPCPVLEDSSRRDWWRSNPSEPRRGVVRDGNHEDFAALRNGANVLVRLTRVSICQSDRRVLAGEKPPRPVGHVLGHEGGGFIVDPGPWHETFTAGQKVVVLPHLSCGKQTCQECHRYMQNLCPEMKHLGFHEHGVLAELMSFPYQCILPMDSNFPDDALPLVDMGCLAALAVRRFWPLVEIWGVEPILERREVVQGLGIVDRALSDMGSSKTGVSFVASSDLEANVAAIAATESDGTVVLFAGINTSALDGRHVGHSLEDFHRKEDHVNARSSLGLLHHLIGSSGYTFDDVQRSAMELMDHYYGHYDRVQNAEILGLAASEMSILGPRQDTLTFPNAVEAMLAPEGVSDPSHGSDIARTLKILIKTRI